MDATIAYNEVASLVRVSIPLLDPRPHFDHNRVLRCHFEYTLQHLPCLQSTLNRWKGMVMAQELCGLLTLAAFCLPNDPSDAAFYIGATLAGQPVNTTPLTCMEQSTINTCFAH